MDSDAARVRVRYLVEEEVAARSWRGSRCLFRHMGVTVCTLARQAPVSSAAARLRETAMEDPPQKRLERLVCIRGLVPGALSACFSRRRRRRLRDSLLEICSCPKPTGFAKKSAVISPPHSLCGVLFDCRRSPLSRIASPASEYAHPPRVDRTPAAGPSARFSASHRPTPTCDQR